MEKAISLEIYAVAAAMGFAVLLFGLWTSNWDFSYWLSNPAVILALAVSQIVSRILSGFGLLITYLVICEGMLMRLSTRLKGNRKSAKRVFSFLIFIPFALLVYSGTKVVFAWFYGTPETLLDVINLIVGLWGLIISVYLLPISRREFKITPRQTDFGTSESKVKKLEISVKRFHHVRIRKRYTEAYRIDVKRIRERLNAWRSSIGTVFLLPFAFGSLVLPPIAFLFLALLAKGSVRRSSAEYSVLDQITLVIVLMVAGGFISIQILASLGTSQLLFEISYLIGTLLGYITFTYIAREIL